MGSYIHLGRGSEVTPNQNNEDARRAFKKLIMILG